MSTCDTMDVIMDIRSKKMIINGKKVTTILFDKDGTLFDSERFRVELRLAYAKIHDFPLTREMLLDCIGKSHEDYTTMLQERIGQGHDVLAFEKELTLYEEMQEEINGVPMRDGAKLFLISAVTSGVTSGLVTSSFHANALASLEKHKITRYFSLIIGVDDVENPKPNPEPYLTAVKQLNAKVEETLVFEDSPSGVMSALAAGLDVVYIRDLVSLPDDLLKDVFLSIDNWEMLNQYIDIY